MIRCFVGGDVSGALLGERPNDLPAADERDALPLGRREHDRLHEGRAHLGLGDPLDQEVGADAARSRPSITNASDASGPSEIGCST